MKLRTSYGVSDSRRAWLAILGLIGGPFAIGGFAGLVKLSLVGAAVGMLASIVAMAIGGFALVRGRSPKTGDVEVSKAGVSVDGAPRIPRERIASATFTPAVGSRPTSVRFVGRNDAELGWIAVPDHAEASRVLGELGLGPEQTSAQFYALARRGSPSFWAFMGVILVALGMAVVAALTAIPAIGFAAILPVLAGSAYLMPARIAVGADGLLYRMRLGSRFFPWSEVESLSPTGRGVAVVLKSGERCEIPTAGRAEMREYELLAQASLLARAAEARDAFHRGVVPDAGARVARLGRTKEKWVAALRDREGSFRDAPLRTDDLWKVLESPAASATARAGAAAVIATEATEEDRARLRIAADVCAEPRLRVVLDKAAAGADVFEALGDVEDDEEPRAAQEV